MKNMATSVPDARIRAHLAFDRLWQRGWMPRPEAYAWLAEQLGLPVEKTHIALFDFETCERVIALSNRYVTERFALRWGR